MKDEHKINPRNFMGAFLIMQLVIGSTSCCCGVAVTQLLLNILM